MITGRRSVVVSVGQSRIFDLHHPLRACRNQNSFGAGGHLGVYRVEDDHIGVGHRLGGRTGGDRWVAGSADLPISVPDTGDLESLCLDVVDLGLRIFVQERLAYGQS